METQWLPVSLVVWITALAGVLDAPSKRGSSNSAPGCIRARPTHCHQLAAQLRRARNYKRYYYLLGSVGRKSLPIAAALLRILLRKVVPGDAPGTPLVFAIDDSPTKRYGPRPGSGKHHNPTPGPAGSPVPLRPRLGLSGSAGPTLALGDHRPTDPLALVHPSPGCGLDGGLLRLAVRDEVGTGRRPDRVAGPAVGARSPSDLGSDRRGLRDRAVLETGDGGGRDSDQPAAVRRRLVVVAAGDRSRSEAGSRPAAEVRQGPPPVWPSARADPRLAEGDVLLVWPPGGQEVQDVPGDLQAGGWCDPCGVGAASPIAGWRNFRPTRI